MKRAWFEKHKIGYLNVSYEFHNGVVVNKEMQLIRIEH